MANSCRYSYNTALLFSVNNDVSTTFFNMENNFKTASNQLPFGTNSDSESPTEPVTQQTVAMLRAKVVPTKQ